jgi:hypothetical protein
MQVDLQQMATILGIGGAIAGVLFLALRTRLGEFFAAADAVKSLGEQVKSLGARITSLEEKMAQMPNEDDMRDLSRRLGDVEVAVARTSTAIEGVAEGQARIERMVNLLLENELRGRQSGGAA